MSTQPGHQHHFLFGTLALPPLDPACRLSVTIPAKDEEDFITATLAALRAQTDSKGTPLDPATYEVIVLANNCTDGTVQRVQAFQNLHPRFRLHVCERTLPPEIACVGTARRLMLDSALVRYLAAGRANGVLCTTDADTRVHPQWVFRTLESVANGAQAVGGRILVPIGDRTTNVQYRRNHLQDVAYRYLQVCLESMIDPNPADPWPRHFQHFGPSTAATVAAYLRSGGLPPLRCLEDVGFARALARVDISVTHNPLVRVYTSCRISDRVDGTAFSHQLDEWATMEAKREQRRVISAANCQRLYKWKVALRRAYAEGCPPRSRHLDELAAALGCSFATLRKRLRHSPTFGALFVEIDAQLEKCPRFNDTPISVAIGDLRRITRSVTSG